MTELTADQLQQMYKIASWLTGPDWKSKGTSDREHNLACAVLALAEELSEANTKIENGLEALLAEGQTAQVRWANAFRVLAGSRCFKKAEDVIE